MKLIRRGIAALLLVAAALTPARAATTLDQAPVDQTTADHLAALFDAYGDSGAGWTGGDGAYSVPLPDGRIAWIFSDTFLGPVNEDGSRPTATPFINNSIVVQDGDLLDTVVGGIEERPRSLVVPPEPGGFYWMGDGTVEDGSLKVFALRFVSAPVPFGFQQVGTDLATLSLPDLRVTGVQHLPYGFVPGDGGAPVSYGMALLEQDPYTYVYGVEDLHVDKFLHLARTPAGDVDGPWEFWTGTEWSDNPLLSARLVGGISNEMSVHRDGDRYVLVAQGMGAGPNVVMSTAPSPEGPWEQVHTVYEAPEAKVPGRVTYNAKAHPEFGGEDSVLVTYNVNTTNGADLYRDVDIYRPRFEVVALP